MRDKKAPRNCLAGTFIFPLPQKGDVDQSFLFAAPFLRLWSELHLLTLTMPPAILYYAIPAFVLLLSVEAWFSYKEYKHLYETKDTFASLGLGTGNVIVGFITKALIFGLFNFLY